MAPKNCRTSSNPCCLCEARFALQLGMRPSSNLCACCFSITRKQLRECAHLGVKSQALCAGPQSSQLAPGEEGCNRWEQEIDYRALVLGTAGRAPLAVPGGRAKSPCALLLPSRGRVAHSLASMPSLPPGDLIQPTKQLLRAGPACSLPLSAPQIRSFSDPWDFESSAESSPCNTPVSSTGELSPPSFRPPPLWQDSEESGAPPPDPTWVRYSHNQELLMSSLLRLQCRLAAPAAARASTSPRRSARRPQSAP